MCFWTLCSRYCHNCLRERFISGNLFFGSSSSSSCFCVPHDKKSMYCFF